MDTFFTLFVSIIQTHDFLVRYPESKNFRVYAYDMKQLYFCIEIKDLYCCITVDHG